MFNPLLRTEHIMAHLSPFVSTETLSSSPESSSLSVPPSSASNLLPSITSSSTAATSNGKTPNIPKKDEDIVIISALRTPITKAKRGGLKDTPVEELLSTVMKVTLERTKIDPATLGDICVGTVLGSNVQRANECRIAQFFSNIPASVPLHTVNRQCSSGLQAIAHVAANIRAGYYKIGLACGVESMSLAAFSSSWQGEMNPNIFLNPEAKACLLPMGITSENVAAKFNISRREQDEFSAASHRKAAEAIKNGRFNDEIVPVKTKIKDPKTGHEKSVVVSVDDGVRPETTAESLSKLPAVFQKDGTTTAGSSSQVSDGAAAVLVTTRGYAKSNHLPIFATLRSYAVVGVPPEIMGIGPVKAIPDALKAANLQIDDIDLFEINEAFASQSVMIVKHLKIPAEKVNVNGGAIALGHPLGCTGARQTATLLYELKKRNARFGVVSMCVGSGMGAAAVYELEQ